MLLIYPECAKREHCHPLFLGRQVLQLLVPWRIQAMGSGCAAGASFLKGCVCGIQYIHGDNAVMHQEIVPKIYKHHLKKRLGAVPEASGQQVGFRGAGITTALVYFVTFGITWLIRVPFWISLDFESGPDIAFEPFRSSPL